MRLVELLTEDGRFIAVNPEYIISVSQRSDLDNEGSKMYVDGRHAITLHETPMEVLSQIAYVTGDEEFDPSQSFASHRGDGYDHDEEE